MPYAISTFPWPSDWIAIQSDLVSAWQISEIQSRRQLTGKSGAFVYLVDIRTPNHDGLAILKLSTANHWGEPEEHIRLKQARDLSPKFAEKHLPVLVRDFRSGDLIATLSAVASDGLNYTTALFELPYHHQVTAGQAIADKLLSAWNSESTIALRSLNADAILREWLGYRLESTSRLSTVPQGILHLPASFDSFRISENDYPNPLRLATGALSSQSIELRPILGYCHGDLHGYNILVPAANTDDPGFCLIDLALFRQNWPLFYDHAYLELSLILRERDQVGVEHWLTIVNALEGIEDNRNAAQAHVDTNDLGLIQKLSFLRARVKSWIIKKYPKRRQDLNNQLLLARIAVGLNFANKPTLNKDAKRSDTLSGYAFLFAASNARKLLDFNKISFAKNGPLAILDGDLPEPTSSAWREVWDRCDSFDRRRNAFILIAGLELRNIPREFRSEFGKIPWALVLDFDKDTDNDGLLSESRSLLASSRGFHFLLPSQIEQPNFREATCWLMSNGWSRQPDSIPTSKEAWSKRTPSRIRKLAEDIRAATSPLPVTTIIMAQGISPALLRQSVVALGEFLSTQQTILVLKNSPDDQSFTAIRDDVECVELQCSYSDFALGLHRMLGPAQGPVAIHLPCRDPSTSKLSTIPLDSELASRFGETIEVVHDGLAFEMGVSQAEVSEFLRGNTISWKELDLDLDARRDITSEALPAIRSLLRQSRSVSYRLAHTPGAGGTTVARRIAWELRNEYPSVVLRVFLDTTTDYLESLFHLTNLPLLVVAERSNISPLLREKLFLDLKARSVRFVLFDVARNNKPSSTETCAALADPMSASEARRFAQRYAAQATSRSKSMISALAENPSMLDYRSAFFFGLYAFDREYQYLPEYVRAKLSSLSEIPQVTITLLALVSFYTPLRVPAAVVCVMMGRPASSVIRIEDLFGSPGKQIVLFDGERMGVTHPLISEEILRQRLTPAAERQGHTSWQSGLADKCIELIDAFGSDEIRVNLAILEILKQLFIEREIWEITESRKKLFSELINSIPNTEAQNRILRHLCKTFPGEAHFWHHFGRHLNYFHIGSIEECLDCFDKAIQLEEYSDVHYHGKGMVYRFAMKDTVLRSLRAAQIDFDSSFNEIQSLCDHADECFRRSYDLETSRQYPLVSNIQVLIEAIEGLFGLWKRGKPDTVDCTSYSSFLMGENTVAGWCRHKLEAAEEMLEELKHLQANGPLSEQTVIVEGKIDEFLGDVRTLIQGLLDLLKRKNANKPYIRRLFARAHFRRVELSRNELDCEDGQTILDMMRENLREDPANDHDLRIWFRIFRQQNEFTLNEAIERMSTWATEGGSVDAFYYLYILHFLRSKQGVPASLESARKYAELCKRKAPILVSKKSFEWWAANSMKRPCPLMNHREIGEWSSEIDFFSNTKKLGYLEGTIAKIDSAQSGVILIDGMPAFFAPRGEFIRSVDLNRPVKCYVGFSYEGLRAWKVKKSES